MSGSSLLTRARNERSRSDICRSAAEVPLSSDTQRIAVIKMSFAKRLGLWSAAVLVAVMLSGVCSAQNEIDLSEGLESNQIAIEEVQELLRNMQLLFENVNDSVESNPNGCSCGGVKCTCCQRIRISKLKLNDNCCISVTYLKRNYGILVKLTFGSRTLFSKEVSARNPPPICAGIPFLKRGGSVCIQFYNLNAGKRTFSGCTRLLGRLLYVTVAKINTGCFRLKFVDESSNLQSSMEMPYIETPEQFEAEELPYLENDTVPLKEIIQA